MPRPYRKIVAEYEHRYPYKVRLANTGDWRFEHCSRAHYQATGGHLIWWHKDDLSVFGFETAEQAATFKQWSETCGIDWTVEPRAQPLPHPEPPPERPSRSPGYRGHDGGPTPRR